MDDRTLAAVLLAVILISAISIVIVACNLFELPYPFIHGQACGFSSSAPGALNMDCECSGRMAKSLLMGGGSYECYGTCSSCACYILNESLAEEGHLYGVQEVPCK